MLLNVTAENLLLLDDCSLIWQGISMAQYTVQEKKKIDKSLTSICWPLGLIVSSSSAFLEPKGAASVFTTDAPPTLPHYTPPGRRLVGLAYWKWSGLYLQVLERNSQGNT